MFAANLNHFATNLTRGAAPQGNEAVPARLGGAFSVAVGAFPVRVDTFSGGRAALISSAAGPAR